MVLRDRLFHYENLDSAFRALCQKTTRRGWEVAGVDGISISAYSRDASRRLHDLSQRLRNNRFSFSSLRPVLFRKPNSKKDRVICVPTVEDRVVQGVVLEWLSAGDRYGLRNGVSYAVRGEGVIKAAERAKKLRELHPHVYRTDIMSFFDAICRADVEAVIRRRVRHTSLRPLLLHVLHCEIEEQTGRKADRIKNAGIYKGRGVRQGMPLSPFFSNILLADFDRAIIKANVAMLRYADDLIFFADSAEQCFAIHESCSKELQKLGLNIPPIAPGGKTQVYAPDHAAEFLGVALAPTGNGAYRLEITDAQQEAVRQEIMQYADGAQLLARGLTLTKYGRSLEGAVAGYCNAYQHCDNVDSFVDKVEIWKSQASERLFKNWLGFSTHKLSAEQRAFLGLPA